MTTKKSLFTCFSTIFCATLIGQNWQANGNPLILPPAQAINTTNNFLGTGLNNNTPIRFGVNFSQDIFILILK